MGTSSGARTSSRHSAQWVQVSQCSDARGATVGADIARGWRQQFAVPVIGVTGSNGKTTVKEMIAAILIEMFGEAACLATRGNLNNDIGVPLTVLRLAPEHRAAVVELGMNHPGFPASFSFQS